eukprot:8235392-Alexandrium_andersonii.AAC.1
MTQNPPDEALEGKAVLGLRARATDYGSHTDTDCHRIRQPIKPACLWDPSEGAGGSEIQKFGNSEILEFGNSEIRKFGSSPCGPRRSRRVHLA